MVNTREIAAEFRLSHWAQVMQERTASGLSVKAYCEREGLHTNSYFYWQRKLREAAYESVSASPEEKSMVPSGWAMCKQAEPESHNSAVSIEIGKFRVTYDESSLPEQLEKVCRVLISLC